MKYQKSLILFQKGLCIKPVGHINSGEEVNTLEDIKQVNGDFIQDCEIEESEIIFTKELTEFVESNLKSYKES